MELPLLTLKRWVLPAVAAVSLAACEKEISVDLPEVPERLVVEGTIEPGLPPFVILTRTQSFFDPLDYNAIANIFVGGATVVVTDNGTPYTLEPRCSNDLSPEDLLLAATLTGLDPTLLAAANICIYTSTDPAVFGTVGHTYRLDVSAGDHTASSITSIPTPVALDSVWFKLAEQQPDDDSLGYAWGRLTDPDTLGNHYRWMARRISHRPNGQAEDPTFISPLGTTFTDKFVNGLTFDFNAIRGRRFYSDQEEDDNEEQGYFKVGDTIAVKFVSIDEAAFDFYMSYDSNVGSTGDIFSTPANVRSNIDGGLGIWAGWGVYMDTIICQ